MLVCFRCTAETKQLLDELVAKGAYRDHGEAISLAIENLALMEKELDAKGEFVLGDGRAASSAARADPMMSDTPLTGDRTQKKQARNTLGGEGNAGKARVRTSQSRAAVAPDGNETQEAAAGIPRIFLRDALPDAEPRGLADLPPDLWTPGQEVPLERWILGQFNRLLPAKANARALIHLFVQNPGALGIAEAADLVAAEAVELGEYLAALDAERNTHRDDALATAFPRRRKDPEKGLMRYANQFVVYQNSIGELSGLMVDLKLINVVTRRKEGRIVPTHTGWRFATLENPVLDQTEKNGSVKFSDAERSFLIDHILRDVPAESFAYRVILEAVKEGADTPDKIDAALTTFVSKDRADELSESFLASQRSGAISRMSDLGLVERHRQGVRVIYGITNDGEQFLSRYAASEKV